MKTLAALGCGPPLMRLIEAAARRNRQTFLPIDHVHIVHRQPLLAGSIRIAAAHAKRVFSLRQPIGHLAPIAAINGLHIDKEFSQEFRSKLRMIKEKLQGRTDARAGRLLRNGIRLSTSG